MRQPTVGRARRRTRQQRLLRTGIGVVVIVVLAALIANLVGGGKKGLSGPGVPQVKFVAAIDGQTDATSKPSKSAVKSQADKIVKLLDEWYQRAFVDPKLYGDGTFPEITKSFDAAAKAAFARDKATMTIGDAREEVKSVEPGDQIAKVTVFFDKNAPKFAIAKVHFTATATMKQSGAYPLKIDQTVTYNFQINKEGLWVVTYYTANQKQDSVVPSTSPTAS